MQKQITKMGTANHIGCESLSFSVSMLADGKLFKNYAV